MQLKSLHLIGPIQPAYVYDSDANLYCFISVIFCCQQAFVMACLLTAIETHLFIGIYFIVYYFILAFNDFHWRPILGHQYEPLKK